MMNIGPNVHVHRVHPDPHGLGAREPDAVIGTSLTGALVREADLEAGPSLVLAPHGDDELLGCGGWLVRTAGLGVSRCVVFVTRRDPLRREESEQALAGLDIEVRDLDLPHHSPWNDEDLSRATEQLQAILKQVAPAYVLLPNRADPHPDHVGTCRLLQRALLDGLEPGNGPWILECEGLVPVAGANWWLDITRELPEKLRRLALYRSQEKRYRLTEIARSLNGYRGRTLLRRGISAAEAYARTHTGRWLP